MMIWVYFDESGEHDEGGTLRRLTLGCGIAPFDAWQQLSREWRTVLNSYCISMFHMADFEARVKPFDGWSKARREGLVNELLDITSRHVPIFCGYHDRPGDIISGAQLRATYQRNIIKAFKETVLLLDRFSGQDITIVFARHKNISMEMIGRIFDFFDHWSTGRIKFGGFAEPLEVEPLQVADIVAYECSRSARKIRPEQERYPLRRLAERAEVFTLYDSSRFQGQAVWGRQFGFGGGTDS
jgi:hypothetical protein